MARRPGGSGRAHGARDAWWRRAGGLVLVGLLSACATAQEGVSDDKSRADAVRAIPWRALDGARRERVEAVVHDATIYRRLPTRVVDCDDELFTFLLDHPDVVVESWNVMGVSRLDLDRAGPNHYRVADNAGAVGDVRVLHREGGSGAPLRMLIVADGVYQTPPMPSPLRGESVLLLRAESVDEPSGRTYVTTRLDSFIRFEGHATRLVAKTLRPLILRTADHNFVETMRFASLFSRTAETNPAGMERLAGHLEEVDAATRREFVTVCYETSGRYEKWRRGRGRLAMGEGADRR